jgi:hypothetical protein
MTTGSCRPPPIGGTAQVELGVVPRQVLFGREGLSSCRPRREPRAACGGRSAPEAGSTPAGPRMISVYVVLRVCRGFAVCMSNKGGPEAVYSWGRNRALLSAKTTDVSRRT